jgi:hypothetical protein
MFTRKSEFKKWITGRQGPREHAPEAAERVRRDADVPAHPRRVHERRP